MFAVWSAGLQLMFFPIGIVYFTLGIREEITLGRIL
jgi:hypothetical protein